MKRKDYADGWAATSVMHKIGRQAPWGLGKFVNFGQSN